MASAMDPSCGNGEAWLSPQRSTSAVVEGIRWIKDIATGRLTGLTQE